MRLTSLLRGAAYSSRIDRALLCARGYSLAIVICKIGAIMQSITLQCSHKLAFCKLWFILVKDGTGGERGGGDTGSSSTTSN
jgi:hypothetical protein